MASPTIQIGNEFIIRDSTYTPRFRLSFGTDAAPVITLMSLTSAGVDSETIFSITNSTGVFAVTAGNFQAAATRITGTADQPIAILDTTTHISLNSSSGAKAITTTSSFDGQTISLIADTVGGGSYTLAVTGGTLTLNSAGEAAIIKRVGSAWQVLALTPSTSTAANIATIV